MASFLFRALVIVNLLLAGQVRSQSFVEVADQAHDIVRYLDARPTSDGGALILAFYNSEGGSSAGFHILRIDVEGTLLWSRATRPVYDMEVHSSGLLYTLSRPGCDISPPIYYLTIWGNDGTQHFSGTYGNPTGLLSMDVRYIADGTTDRLALFGASSLLITSLSGDSLTSRQLPNPYTKGTWLSNGELLLIGANELKRLDALGSDLSSSTITGAVLDVKARADGCLLLFADRIEAYDNALQLTSIVALDTTLGLPKRFLQATDTCMVHTTNGVLVLDEQLATLDTIPLMGFPDHTISAVLPNALGLMSIGTVAFEELPVPTSSAARSSGVIRGYDRAGNTTMDGPDVALEILSLDPIVVEGAATFRHLDALVRITNNGADTVREVFVTHQPDPWPWTCGIIADSFSLVDLAIAPGQSTEQQLDGVFLLYNAQPVNGPYDAEVCMWALSPNAMVDRDTSDNYACATLGDVITTIGEVADDAAFSAYPNPTRDKVYLVGLPEDLGGYCELIDALGSTSSVSVSQGSTGVVEADLSHMPSGTYRLVYRNEHRLLWTTVCLVR